MNIFVLDTDQSLCAQYHCDKHVVKMIVESSQLLCSAHHVFGYDAPYALTHQNHQCAIWTRECVENYDWLTRLAYALCLEYTYRYDKIHKSQSVVEWCAINKPDLKILGHTTPFALAMPVRYIVKEEYIQTEQEIFIVTQQNSFSREHAISELKETANIKNDAVESYRAYYRSEKASIATWKKRSIPYWF